MNSVIAFYERQYGNYNWRQYDRVLSRLYAHKQDCWHGIAPSNLHADFNPEPPIFAAKFANCNNFRHLLAIANEDGKIAIQDTNIVNDHVEERALAGDQCHNNAVFDLEWMPGQMQLVSASGDHTASLWQIRENKFEHIRSFHGHTRSVKTAAFRKTDPSCFATGGRDGAILIWDIRSRSSVGTTPKADNCIYSGHAGGPGTPHAYKRKASARNTPRLPPNTSSSSITGLVFQDDNTLVSCGAGDGIIKVWDLRRNYSCYKKEPLPKHSIPYPGTSTFKGYTNLLIDNSGLKLYVNCMDHNIYCFNLGTYSTQPIMQYRGLTNSTFYIKSSLSADGQYLLSGSSDEKAYIWNVASSKPLLTLVGHNVEVTCVAWAKTKDIRIVTCSDDARHKVWRIDCNNLDEDNSQIYKGKTEMCTEYRSCGGKSRLKALENTPRTLKRIVEVNETTPSSTEKVSMKRLFSDMCSSEDLHNVQINGGDQKRQLIETRARRLFVTSSTSAIGNTSDSSDTDSSRNDNYHHGISTILPEISEETESSPKDEKLLSPLNERNHIHHQRISDIRTPSSAYNRPSCSMALFSPTSNLPNYVIDGDAPHLKLQSPKRKLKENIDWLTKIRKQKLLSTKCSQFNEKLNNSQNGQQSTITTATTTDIGSTNDTPYSNDGILSPRMRKIKSSDRNAYGSSPARRMSTCHQQHHTAEESTITTTPTRRNSETTLLRFFSKTPHNNSVASSSNN